MEGVTDSVVRAVYASLGGVDYCVSEFIRVSENVLPPKVLVRECPEISRGAVTVGGVPVHVQLLGGDPGRVAQTARVAVECGARAIDLNFGCPAPTVNRHDGGASLLRDPARVQVVTRAVRDALPDDISVSAKVRTGWADADHVEDIARAAEQGGAAWITVHGRTRTQGYAPPADWTAIARAARAVRVPVVANGDLRDETDVRRCHEITGCERFMLGRGAIERPEVFRLLRGLDASPWTAQRKLDLILEFAARSVAACADRERVTLARVKQWLRALAAVDADVALVFDDVKRLQSLPDSLTSLHARTRMLAA